MNIAIMSPHCHSNGNTTVAALVAASLAKQNTKVCLTHVRAKSDSLYPYFGIQGGGSAATDAVQLAKLIRTGGMQKGSITNYCRNIAENFDVFSLDADTEITDDELTDVAAFVMQSNDYDYVVCDVDENSMDRNYVQAIVENADIVILVITQAMTELRRFNEMKQTFLSRTKKSQRFVVVNKFRTSLGTMKDEANVTGIPAFEDKECDLRDVKRWHPLHDNQFIPYCENKGGLLLLWDQIKRRNGEVLELSGDLERIAGSILIAKREIARERSVRKEKIELM